MHDLRTAVYGACSACRSPSSPGPAPARSSPASPTTSAACRPPSPPPRPPWSPTSPAWSPRRRDGRPRLAADRGLAAPAAALRLDQPPVGNERKKITPSARRGRAVAATSPSRSPSAASCSAARWAAPTSLTDSSPRSPTARRPRGAGRMAGRWRMAVITIVIGRHARRHLLDRRLALVRRPGAVSIGTLVAFVSLQHGLFRPAVACWRPASRCRPRSRSSSASSSTSTCPSTSRSGTRSPRPGLGARSGSRDVEFRYDDAAGRSSTVAHRPGRGQPRARRPDRRGKSTLRASCRGCTT